MEFGIVGAAFSALGAFANVCGRGVYAALPGSVWAVESASVAVRACLESPHAAARLGASRFVSEFPTDVLREALLGRLDDPIFTVRWRSILALHRIGTSADLAGALDRSRPAVPDPIRNHEFYEVSRALG